MHFKASGVLVEGSPRYPCSRTAGDIDKLSRSILDALTGIVYEDDSQVVILNARKEYLDVDIAIILIKEL